MNVAAGNFFDLDVLQGDGGDGGEGGGLIQGIRL